VLDHEHVQRSRLRVDARFRLMEKLAPEKYGVKQQIVVTRDEERARYEGLSARIGLRSRPAVLRLDGTAADEAEPVLVAGERNTRQLSHVGQNGFRTPYRANSCSQSA
jgi:hypothetical protein